MDLPVPTASEGVSGISGRSKLRSSLLLAFTMLGLWGHAQTAFAQRTFSDLPKDPVLNGLVEESLSSLPELRGARESEHAESARVSQAGALPDPVLTLGIQNDGFRSIEIGEAETSFWRIELSQPLPWPGKRDLRTQSAKLAVDRARAYVERMRLSTEASVRRAYLDLLLVRDRLHLLGELERVWAKSADIARGRYQAGLSAQSDVYRAELEVSRLRQRRFALIAEERRALQTLNRLRGHKLEDPIETSLRVEDLTLPEVSPLEAAMTDAKARSPELRAAQLGVAQAKKQVQVAERDRYPDMSVAAGIMPRGSMPPMWSASVSIGLPVWSSVKQSRAVDEQSARAKAEAHSEESVAQAVALQAADRSAALRAAVDTISVYRDGLLTQSQATVESTLAQYQVGKVTFASVLEANVGYLNDREGHLIAITQAHRIAIADAEVALQPTDLTAVGAGMNAGSGPSQSPMGQGGSGMGSSTNTGAAPASSGGATAAPMM